MLKNASQNLSTQKTAMLGAKEIETEQTTINTRLTANTGLRPNLLNGQQISFKMKATITRPLFIFIG